MDEAAVAADVIDRVACVAAQRAAVEDEVVVEPRELDAVVVAARADVAHLDVTQHDVVRGGVEGAAVVDVEAIDRRVREDEVLQHHLGDVAEVQDLGAAVPISTQSDGRGTSAGGRAFAAAGCLPGSLEGHLTSLREETRPVR